MKETNYFQRLTFSGPLIDQPPTRDIALAIVIPACDEPDLVNTLTALKACDMPQRPVEIIVVINHGAAATARVKTVNAQCVTRLNQWVKANPHSGLQCFLLFVPDLPPRKAGVGLARKIGMDEAARRAFGVSRSDLPLVCLDADCQVSKDYLTGLHGFFSARTDIEGCAIHFEHSLDGLDFWQRDAIVDYELHLRCMISWQRWAGLPFAYQTVGSSMAVRAGTYVAVGGMNTRQAGEDFYFLHKVIERGQFADCAYCAVYPSPRVSDRVPFGTGRAIGQVKQGEPVLTHHPEVYRAVRRLVKLVPRLWDEEDDLSGEVPEVLGAFLAAQGWPERLAEIRANT
ncbi:MAG: hypothetical protein R3301_13140, partial [Saprospiraceae bacterium]|nr:hypothetical protein [Saprospiraceae bacterium]